jgi:hypothetical protein
MSWSQHARLLVQAVIVWALFWLAGWPDYFQQYDTVLMAVGCTLLSALFGIAAVIVLARVRRERRMRRALWTSFYFTVPFALLDWLYCGVYLGLGASFLHSHWYLSVFYVSVWLQFPPTAWALDRFAVDNRTQTR